MKKEDETFEEIGLLEGESDWGMGYSYYQGAAYCFPFVDKNRSEQNLNRVIDSCERAGIYKQVGKMS